MTKTNIDINYKRYNKGWIYKGSHHTETKVSPSEVKQFLKTNGGMFFANCYDFDCKEITNFWYIIKDSFEDMENLKASVRHHIKKALRSFEINPIQKEDLIENGYNAYRTSYVRYGTSNFLSETEWKEMIRSLPSNTEFWAVKDPETKEVFAYSENLIQDNSVKYAALKANPISLKKYAFYGLIYLMNRHYLTERGVLYVTDGRRTITEHSNIQDFLCDRLNFRKAYTHIDIYYPWYSRIMINLLYPIRNIKFLPGKLKLLLKFDSYSDKRLK